MAARPQREEPRQGDLFIFFCSLCSPCFGRRRNSILPYAPNHLAFSPRPAIPHCNNTSSTINASSLHMIYLHSSSIRHILLDISETFDTLKPSLSVCNTFDELTTKPPPRSIGQEATAAPHWARSHRCAAPGKKPPPRRIGQEATAAPHRARSHRRAVSD